MTYRILTAFLTLAIAAFGSGGKPPVTPPNPAGPAEVKVLNETQPAGGTVQLKYMLTEPKPIMTGTSGSAFGADFFSDIDGIQLFSDTGDVFGVALFHNGYLRINFSSPNHTFGSSVDYPILTVAARIRGDAKVGETANFALDPQSFWLNSAGQVNQFIPKPGTIKVGGSVSIANVIPGGGSWKTGTVIRVMGMGFQPGTTVRILGPKTSPAQFVSPNEMDLTLLEDAVMDGQRIDATDPDRSTDSYFSYMRGVPQGQSSSLLLTQAVPIFSTITHSQASITEQAIENVLTGLAIQNPNGDTVQVALAAFDPSGNPAGQANISLPFGARITRELGEYFGTSLPSGSVVRVSSSLPVQMLGLLADTSAWVVAPLSPAF